jgi:calcineurin-like phosphoesterase family protein
MLIISDVHLGNHKQNGGAIIGGVNARFEQTLQTLKDTLDKNPHEPVVIAGDLFDKSTPTMAQVGKVAAILRHRLMPTYLMMGNHDHNSSGEYDYSFSPLCSSLLVELITKPQYVNVENLRVFLCPYPHHLLDQEVNHADAAIAHAGIADGATPSFLISDKVLEVGKLVKWQEKYSVPYVFSGDWHARSCWLDGKAVSDTTILTSKAAGTRQIQIGALAPTGFDNQGFAYGSAWVLKKDSQGPKVALQHALGPRFLRSDDREAVRSFVERCKLLNCEPYVRFDGTMEPICENFSQPKARKADSKVSEAAVQLRSDQLIDKVVYEQVTTKVPADMQQEVMSKVLGYLKGTV